MMKKIFQIYVLIVLALIFTDAKAQEVTAKDIADQAAKAVLDKENIATASAAGIKGTLTTVKMSAGQKEDLKKGFYAGILELEVKSYGNLKSGKFNMFFKDGRQGLRLYLEEKGTISGIFEVRQTTPENYKETSSGDKPLLAFPEFSTAEKLTQNFASMTNQTAFSFSSFWLLRRCKIYIKIYINGHRYWVWSGATRDCGTPAR